MDESNKKLQLTLICADPNSYWGRDPLDFSDIGVSDGKLVLPRKYARGEVIYSQNLIIVYQFQPIAYINFELDKLNVSFSKYGNALSDKEKMDIVEHIEQKIAENPALFDAYMMD